MFHWILPSFLMFNWVWSSFAKFSMVWLSFHRFYWVLPSFLMCSWDLSSFAGVLLNFTKFSTVWPSFHRFYWVLPSFLIYNWVLTSFVGFSLGFPKFLSGLTQFPQVFTGFFLVFQHGIGFEWVFFCWIIPVPFFWIRVDGNGILFMERLNWVSQSALLAGGPLLFPKRNNKGHLTPHQAGGVATPLSRRNGAPHGAPSPLPPKKKPSGRPEVTETQ